MAVPRGATAPAAPRLTVVRPERRRLGFMAAFEMIGECVAVYNANGRLLHETAAYRTLRGEPGTGRLMQVAVSTMTTRAMASIRRDETPDPVCTRGSGCVVHVTLYQPADEPMLLAHVHPARNSQPSMTDEQIVSRFGLTPAELRVARLLAAGKSNKQIAYELGVSEHTTRHQTESVLRKLEIKSRSGVAIRMLGS